MTINRNARKNTSDKRGNALVNGIEDVEQVWESGSVSEWVSMPAIDSAGYLGASTGSVSGPIGFAGGPSFRLLRDTGRSNTDGVTSAKAVSVSNLPAGAAWQYRVDGGEWRKGGLTLADLTTDSISGRMGGLWLPGTVAVRATDLQTVGRTATAWLVAFNGIITKGVKAEFSESTAGQLQVRVVEAAYMFGNHQLDWSKHPRTSVDLFSISPGLEYALRLMTVHGVSVNGGDYIGSRSASSLDQAFLMNSSDGRAHSYEVRQSDGLTSRSSASGVSASFRLDTHTVAPTIEKVTGDDRINASEMKAGVRVKGTAEADSSVLVQWEGSFQTVVADADGNWFADFISTDVPADGDSDITARATDVAGNTSETVARTVKVDTFTAKPKLGVVAGDDQVNAAERTAGVKVTGSAEAGSRVSIQWGSSTHEATTDAGGNWSTTFAAGELPSDGSTRVEAKATDAAGNTSDSDVRTVKVDTTSVTRPDISQAIDDVGSITGNLVANAATDDLTPTLRVQLPRTPKMASAGDRVQLQDGNTPLGDAVVLDRLHLAMGYVDITPPAHLAEGVHLFTARITDVAGNVSEAASDFALKLDRSRPGIALIDTVAGDDRVSGAEKSAGVIVRGTAEAGSTVSLQWGLVTKTITADAKGKWRSTFAPGEVPADGSTSMTARVTDAAGNSADVVTKSIIVQTTLTTPKLALEKDSGFSSTDGITNHNVVTIAGLESGASWKYQVDGGAWLDGTQRLRLADLQAGSISAVLSGKWIPGGLDASALDLRTEGNTRTAWLLSWDGTLTKGVKVEFSEDARGLLQVKPLAAAYVVGLHIVDWASRTTTPVELVTNETGEGYAVRMLRVSGALAAAGGHLTKSGAGFSDVFTLSEGMHNYVVQQIDAQGNTGISASSTYMLDTKAAASPSIIQAFDNVGSKRDPIPTRGVTDDLTPTVRIDLTSPRERVSSGRTVQLYDDGKPLGGPILIEAGHKTAGYIDYTPPIDLSEGTHLITAAISDIAGNVSRTASEYVIKLDVTKPQAPTLNLVADTGSSSSDGITKNTSVKVSGLEIGSTWFCSLDGGRTWDNFGAVTTNEGIFKLSSGVTYPKGTVQIKQIDAAGNESVVGTNPARWEVDTTVAPLHVSFENILSSGMTIEGDVNPAIVNVGNLAAGATWQFSLDAGSTWETGRDGRIYLPKRNHILNGEFNDAYNWFKTGYEINHDQGSLHQGQIITTHSAESNHIRWYGQGTHIPGDKFLLVDGQGSRGGFWHQSVSMVKGQVYEFSYYRRTTEHSLYWSKAALEVQINWPGSRDWRAIGISDYIEEYRDVYGWTQITKTFTAEASGESTIALLDTNDTTAGNDFSVDTISLHRISYAEGHIRVRQTDVAGNTTVTLAPAITPIALDLDASGSIETVRAADSNGTFDLNNDGQAVHSAWIAQGDAWLAVDGNGNGVIDNRDELFGGEGARDAFIKLAGFDSNHDGRVDADDARFHQLLVWRDANGDHQSQADELMTMQAAGVSSLKLRATIDQWFIDAQGVTHGDTATAVLASGREVAMTDLWLPVRGMEDLRQQQASVLA